MLETQLPAGQHVLTMSVPGGNPQKDKTDEARAAILVRVTLKNGKSIYFDGREAQTIEGRPTAWDAMPGSGDGWTAARIIGGDPAPLPSGSAYLLRRPFQVQGAVNWARLYVTALGAYEAELNGAKVGDALLTPEFTDYQKHAIYRVYDIAGVLRQGENVLGGIIGEGWYGSEISPGGRYSFGTAPLRYMAQLEIRYADGRKEVVAGDDQWTVARAPITSSGIYDGEDYDARLEIAGWSGPGRAMASEKWEVAQVAPAPPCDLVGATVPPIRRNMRLPPKKIRKVGNNSYVIDFGQNFAGWARLRVRGRRGQRLTLRYAELVNADGTVDQSNLRGARATDTYVARGDKGGEAYEPRFTYHGFRYLQVDGLDEPLRADQVDGVVIYNDLNETGALAIGSYVPQRLWQNTLWSQRSNFVGIPTDCPQRDERLGWTGDAHVFWDAAAFNMDVAAFTSRFMRDVRDAQRRDGAFPDIAPDASHGGITPAGSSPGWADAGVILPWTIWRRYGDTGIIDDNWAAMTKFMASIRNDNPELIWARRRGNDFGDWLALDAKQPGDPTTPKDLIGTAMWKAAADAMADMAAATGRSAEAAGYRTLSKGLKEAFIRAFVRGNGEVGNGSQTGYIHALHFDLLPPQQRTRALANLVRDIRRRGKLLSTGFLGTPYSLDVLANGGEVELAYDLLLRTEYPSWGYMIAKDATTIWERWNGDVGDQAMNSFNHYALGAVIGFIYRRIAGIDPTAPGFASFRFDPVYDQRLKTAGGHYRSRSGHISANWKRGPAADFHLSLLVPPNSEATVILPARELHQIRESRAGVAAAAFRATDRVNGKIAVVLGAGSYEFDVSSADFG
jgi:alpha-L-rhamnosidase